MKKSRFSLIICLILSLSLSLVGCGRNDADTTTTSITATEGLTYAPAETVYNIITQAEETQSPVTDAPTTQAPTTTEVPSTEAPTQAPETQAPATQAPATTGVGKYVSTYKGTEQAVFYPDSINTSTQALPVVAWANGTGFSYTIYESLIKEIAEGGYIVVANSETMSADGTAQIASLDFVISENSNSSSILYGRVNTDMLAVAGHSQGGRSSVNAAAQDSRIDCVISVAGSNFVEEAEKLSTPTLFFAGSRDMIVGAERWVAPAYDACNGPAVYVNLINGIHTTCSTSPETYSGYIISWLNVWLRSDTSAKALFTNGGQLSQDSAWQDFRCKLL